MILFFAGWINLGKLRVPGVLQRFGISYFFVASTGMIFKASSIPKPFVRKYHTKYALTSELLYNLKVDFFNIIFETNFTF